MQFVGGDLSVGDEPNMLKMSLGLNAFEGERGKDRFTGDVRVSSWGWEEGR
jgi:hypothetical protein